MATDAVQVQSRWEHRMARWVVFVCADQGHPMKVGYEPQEYAGTRCPCGAALVPITVKPVATADADVQLEANGSGGPFGV